MPTVLRIGSYRFHFYSDEGVEPAHVHVRTPDGECKFWLDPIALAFNRSVKIHNLREIERAIFEHRDTLLKAFYAYHSR